MFGRQLDLNETDLMRLIDWLIDYLMNKVKFKIVVVGSPSSCCADFVGRQCLKDSCDWNRDGIVHLIC